MSKFIYVKTFIKDKNIAAITPTSQVCVKKVCSKIDFEHADVIVEYGPGDGVFTKYLLKRMKPTAKLLVIELNKTFVAHLKKKFHDKRLYVFNESAENILDVMKKANVDHVDYILSGIPFSFLPNDLRNRLLANTHCALRTGGKFLPYQMFYQPNRHLKTPLTYHFGNVDIEYEILSFPPVRIYEAIKKESSQTHAALSNDGMDIDTEAPVLQMDSAKF